jgi:hypothetical protein
MRQIQTSLLSNRRARRWRSRLTGCLVAFLVVNPSGDTETWAAADRPQSGKTVTVGSGLQFHNGLLTAHVRATPLPQVLSEVSRLSGAKVVWLGQPDLRQVSVTFTALPIAEAIPRVLGGNNFLLVYASTEDKARLKEIWIATRPSPTQTGISPTLESAPMTEGINVNEGASELPQEFAPIPDEETATAIEAEIGGMLESQLDTALHDADRDRRLDAISVLGGFVQQDARIRPVLQQLSTSEHDPRVRTAATEMLAEVEE